MPPVKREIRPGPKATTTASTVPPSPSAGAIHETDLVALELADQLHSAAIHLLRRLRVRDRESGVGPAQLSALSVLVFGGPKSLAELAEIEQVKRPPMSGIVASLEQSKLEKTQAEKDDARRIRIVPTAKGEQVMWEGRKRRV